MRIFLLCSFLVLLNCKNQPQIDVQGHRGCRGLYPENSIPAFQKAIEFGVQTLELDLAISKDKKVLVSHEPFMNHEIALDYYGNEIPESAEKTYNLYTMTYDSIKGYDVGSKQHPRFPDQKKMKVYKPLLAEVIDLAEAQTAQQMYYNIEIKSQPQYDGVYSPEVDEFVALVLDVVNSKQVFKRTIIQSFDVRALEAAKQQWPQIKVALLVDENESINSKLAQLSFKPEIVSPYYKLLDQVIVDELQDDNMKVIPWTLNEKKAILEMIDFNVDGIISDYPDVVIELTE